MILSQTEPKPPLRLLLVEDNSSDVRLLTAYLEEADPQGFAVTRADRLARAQELLGQQIFDLILVDLVLPDSHGLDTFRALSRTKPGTPLVVLTRLDDEEMALAALALGAQDYLVKGRLEPLTLSRSLRYAVARHQALAGELGSLGRLTETPTTAITALSYGQLDLRDANPDMWGRLVTQYQGFLEALLERDAYRVPENLSQELKDFAETLGYFNMGPRDVLELHTEAIKLQASGKTYEKLKILLSEGRMLALELMGYLVSYYRSYCLGIHRFKSTRVSQGPATEGGH